MPIRKIGYLFVYIVSLLILLEGITRIENFARRATACIFNTDFMAIIESDRFGQKGKPYGVFREIRLNKYGFNDSDDYVKEKKTHAVRILCLGNSVTFGYADRENNWPRFLGELFKAHHLDVEVINAAFPGNSFTSLLAQLRTDYISFSPDIVLIYCGFISYSRIPYRDLSPRMRRIRKLINSSFFLKKLIYIKHWDYPPDFVLRVKRKLLWVDRTIPEVTPEHMAAYKKDLDAFVSVCESHKIIPVLSSFPCLINEKNYPEYSREIYSLLFYYPALEPGIIIKGAPFFNRITKEKAAECKLPFVELSYGIEPTKEYFMDYHHLTAKGEQQIAYNFYSVLAPLIKTRMEKSAQR